MSLLRHGREIARAVAGDLPPPRLEALRRHLRGCDACRGRYDALARTADALDGGAATAARERSALVAALDGGAATAASAPPPAVSRAAWLRAAFVLAPVAVIAIWLRGRAVPPEAEAPDGVTLRGAAEAPAAPFELVLHASRSLGDGARAPVRLLGELPGSGELRVSRADFVQLGFRGLRAPAHVRVVTAGAAGAPRDELPGADHGGLLARAGAGLVSAGPSVMLARGRPPGPVRVVALASPRPIADADVRAALAGAALDPAVAMVAGLLIVEP